MVCFPSDLIETAKSARIQITTNIGTTAAVRSSGLCTLIVILADISPFLIDLITDKMLSTDVGLRRKITFAFYNESAILESEQTVIFVSYTRGLRHAFWRYIIKNSA